MIRLYKRLLAFLTGTSLFVIFSVVLVSSLSRYLLNSPIQWSEEVARYAMIYGTMFGTVLCYLHGLHIRFSFLENLVKPTIKKALQFISDLVTLGSGAVLAYSGYLFMMKRGAINAPAVGIQMYYFQAAMVVGGVMLAIAAVLRLTEYFTGQYEETK
ncbi:Sialic acid TRAP transporter permease protein SiaT [Marinomonas gallaica]|uniref:TRAP transporter small permease protein n=1 Tax=Marinomonas gallaica TaxID=1806667 RepID=A0A1C3JTM2_9GAMM|nr:TRAP transporter small permease [Marinomonas gallaica]SBT18571.1 Sialic acid TRAP transporter permease protein SiaT [Marinomonas gallaica]SBT21526.1 Sialic acid TRAP transporter permease protein SiaT [Marinomonas gallaica]